jgi:hypothetical protein
MANPYHRSGKGKAWLKTIQLKNQRRMFSLRGRVMAIQKVLGFSE